MHIKEERPHFNKGTPISVSFINVRHYHAHTHINAVELIYCFSGKVNVISAHVHTEMVPGDLVTLYCEDIHCIYSDEDNLLMVLHLDLSKTQYTYEEIQSLYLSCATIFCRPHQEEAMEKVYDIIIGLAYAWVRENPFPASGPALMFEKLVDILFGNFLWFSIEHLTPEENSKFSERLNNIIIYVIEHYKEKITITALAEREYINDNYLSQFMKRTPFYSFTLMVNYIRCYEAEKLLLNTELSIEEISDKCGFSSKKYFHKYFKHFWETTPLQHRKWHKNYATCKDDVFCYTPEELLPVIKTYIAERHLKRVMKD